MTCVMGKNTASKPTQGRAPGKYKKEKDKSRRDVRKICSKKKRKSDESVRNQEVSSEKHTEKNIQGLYIDNSGNMCCRSYISHQGKKRNKNIISKYILRGKEVKREREKKSILKEDQNHM